MTSDMSRVQNRAMRSVACSRCGACPGERCRSRNGKPASWHVLRWDEAIRTGAYEREKKGQAGA